MTIIVMIGRNRNGGKEIAEIEEWRVLLLLETPCCWTKIFYFWAIPLVDTIGYVI
jgi:hypothetical protein